MRASAVLAIAVLASAPAHAGKRDWTGSTACGACHPKELAAWQATPHGKTAARWTAAPDPRCLACHGTGEAPAGPTLALEVGCESCHGAGAAYGEDDVMRDRPLALALGMVDLSTPKLRAAACSPCHTTRMGKTPFDPTAAVHLVKP